MAIYFAPVRGSSKGSSNFRVGTTCVGANTIGIRGSLIREKIVGNKGIIKIPRLLLSLRTLPIKTFHHTHATTVRFTFQVTTVQVTTFQVTTVQVTTVQVTTVQVTTDSEIKVFI
ncbi:MAG: hypothetical protein RL023_925, partial [Candidatus Parcubacteria bacterium]